MNLSTSHTTADPAAEVENVTVGALLRRVAEQTPEQVAVVECRVGKTTERTLNYQQLLESAEAIGRWALLSHEPGDHIGIWAPNSLDWYLLQLGFSLAGITLVTVNPAFLKEEADYVLNHSGCKTVITVPDYRGAALTEIAQDIANNSATLANVLDLNEVPSLVKKADTQAIALPDVGPDSPCMIQYTSGTTGTPKGATLGHAAVVNYAKFAELGLELPKGSKWVNFMPMFHTGGCIYMALGCLWNKGVHLLVDSFDAEYTLQLIEEHRAHFLWCVPTMYFTMFEHPNFEKYDKSSLVVVASGATTVPPELVTRLETHFTGEFIMLFGQTERGMICQTTRGDTLEHKSRTVGRAMPHTELKIASVETGDPLPVGEVGEICVRSPSVMLGYHQRPEATDAAIDQDGWLHTGDLGVMAADGYCAITGRIKDMIIRGGENIFPREIEDVLIEHPDVLDISVFGIPDKRWGEQVAAAVRVAPGATSTDQELADYLRDKLARHKIPRAWMRMDAFPVTASGKVKKFELRDQYVRNNVT